VIHRRLGRHGGNRRQSPNAWLRGRRGLLLQRGNNEGSPRAGWSHAANAEVAVSRLEPLAAKDNGSRCPGLEPGPFRIRESRVWNGPGSSPGQTSRDPARKNKPIPGEAEIGAHFGGLCFLNAPTRGLASICCAASVRS
jgi:hypothetical protein